MVLSLMLERTWMGSSFNLEKNGGLGFGYCVCNHDDNVLNCSTCILWCCGSRPVCQIQESGSAILKSQIRMDLLKGILINFYQYMVMPLFTCNMILNKHKNGWHTCSLPVAPWTRFQLRTLPQVVRRWRTMASGARSVMLPTNTVTAGPVGISYDLSLYFMRSFPQQNGHTVCPRSSYLFFTSSFIKWVKW